MVLTHHATLGVDTSITLVLATTMVEHITPFEALNSILAKAGSQSELARQLGCTQGAVWKWLQTTKRVGAKYVLKAERLYGISRHDFRPDIYPRSYPPAPGERWNGVDRRADRAA